MESNIFGDGWNWEDHIEVAVEDGLHPASKGTEWEDIYTKYLGTLKGKKVCDFGCHVGRFIPFLEEMGFHYTGIDQSKEALKVLKRINSKGKRKLIESFLCDINIKNTFDAGWICAVLQHNDESSLDKSIRKIHKSMKKGGVLIIQEESLPENPDKWVTAFEKYKRFKCVKRWHENELGVEDRYAFVKP